MVVVDTNVAVVANALSEQASEDCVETRADRLEEIIHFLMSQNVTKCHIFCIFSSVLGRTVDEH